MDNKIKYIKEAIKVSVKSVSMSGGPYGAVIVKDGRIISMAGNSVTSDHDPTAHAEVNAIRQAAQKLKSFDLSGCEIYCSCEPCPMCLGAIYWARIDKIYYANSSNEAKKAGFDDSFIYEECSRPADQRKAIFEQVKIENADEAFRKWKEKEDKKEY
jgi:tRNA(Arg) A34 adenosine deaminase TadA